MVMLHSWLIVHGVRSVLLVLCNGRFSLNHLHLHGSRHEELAAILTVNGLPGVTLHLLLEDWIVLLRVLATCVVVLHVVVSDELSLSW